MSLLYWTVYAGVFVGLACGCAVWFLDPCARLSRLLHAGPTSRFFFAADTVPIAVPIMILLIFGAPSLLNKLAGLLAGRDRAIWAELGKIAPAAKWMVYLYYVFIVTSALILIVVAPLLVDSYINVTDTGIAFSRFQGFGEQRYAWRQIVRVDERVYEREEKQRSYTAHDYTIHFSDGETLSMDEGDQAWRNYRQIPAAVRFIISHAHVPVRHVQRNR